MISLKGSRILVVDDEMQFLSMSRTWLQGEGCIVTTASNGSEARKLFRSGDYDVVLLDLNLGDCDGLDLIREFRVLRDYCEIIVITGYGTVKDAVYAVKAGAFDFLEKPVSLLDRLNLTIGRALEKSRLKRKYRYSDLMMGRAAEKAGNWIIRRLEMLAVILDIDLCWICLPGYGPDSPGHIWTANPYYSGCHFEICEWTMNQLKSIEHIPEKKPVQPLIINTPDTLPEFLVKPMKQNAEDGIGSVVLLPFYEAQTPVAVLCGASRLTDKVWTSEHLHMLQLTGAVIMGAMESEISAQEIKRLSEDIVTVVDEERIRIGRDLHDGLGQEMAGLAFIAQVLKQKLDFDKTLQAEADTIVKGLNRSVRLTRRISRSLSPVDGKWHGAAEAMESLAHLCSETWKARCVFEGIGDLACISHKQGYNIYRIAQEAITNFFRHGMASLVKMRLSVDESQIELTVLDNGAGMDCEARFEAAEAEDIDGGGRGLRIMGARAGVMGGTLKVENVGVGGVLLSCVIPVSIKAEATGK